MWLNMAELKPPFPPWQLLLLGFFLGVSAGVQADDLSLGGSPEAAPGKPRELSYSEFYVGLYGPGRRFDVLRKGRRIGSYDMAFRSLGEELEVRVATHIQVSFLLFFEYRFDSESVARWDARGLRHILIQTVDGSKESRVEAERLEDGGYRVTATAGGDELEYVAAAPLFPNNQWNADVLEAGQVLDTLTGHLHQVTIQHEGRESLPMADRTVTAEHFRYQGELQQDAWYDERGRLLKLRFPSRDGVPVEFLCTTCGVLP